MAEFEAEPDGSFLLIDQTKTIAPSAQRLKCARASAGQSWNCFEPHLAPEHQCCDRRIFSPMGGAVSIG
jgi:hypothetical protein